MTLADTLASYIPGLPVATAAAWLACEQSPGAWHATNPLNIRWYGSAGQIANVGGFATYATPEAGLKAAAGLILGSGYYGGVRAALGKGAHTVAVAIEQSPWAAGHYGGSMVAGIWHDGCIARQVADNPVVTHSTPSVPIDPAKVIPAVVCTVTPGGDVYADPDRRTRWIAAWAGGNAVGLYGLPTGGPVNGSYPLAPIRVDFGSGGSDLRVGWVGRDHVTNVRTVG